MNKEQFERQLNALKNRIARKDNQSNENYISYLTQLLEDTFNIAIHLIYPYEENIDTLPTIYENWQLRVCSYLDSKADFLGITSYSENGIRIDFGSDHIPNTLLNEIVPYVGVIE